MNARIIGFVGLAATIWFWVALFLFAAFVPNYTHATKAVSELGALGTPNAVLWNVFGFGLVGVCLTLSGFQAARLIKPDSKVASVTLLLSGVAFALTAIPADMNDLSAFTSRGHIVASVATGGLWFIGAACLVGGNAAGKYHFNFVTLASLFAVVVTILIRGADVMMPGYGQRLSLLVYFVWFAYVSVITMTEAGR